MAERRTDLGLSDSPKGDSAILKNSRRLIYVSSFDIHDRKQRAGDIAVDIDQSHYHQNKRTHPSLPSLLYISNDLDHHSHHDNMSTKVTSLLIYKFA